jgi:hypothetical protein
LNGFPFVESLDMGLGSIAVTPFSIESSIGCSLLKQDLVGWYASTSTRPEDARATLKKVGVKLQWGKIIEISLKGIVYASVQSQINQKQAHVLATPKKLKTNNKR